jgi:hypothetical protein
MKFFHWGGYGTSFISNLDPLSGSFGGILIDQAKHPMHVMFFGRFLGRVDNVEKMKAPNRSSIPTMRPLEGGVSCQMIPSPENASTCASANAQEFGTVLPLGESQVL